MPSEFLPEGVRTRMGALFPPPNLTLILAKTNLLLSQYLFCFFSYENNSSLAKFLARRHFPASLIVGMAQGRCLHKFEFCQANGFFFYYKHVMCAWHSIFNGFFIFILCVQVLCLHACMCVCVCLVPKETGRVP